MNLSSWAVAGTLACVIGVIAHLPAHPAAFLAATPTPSVVEAGPAISPPHTPSPLAISQPGAPRSSAVLPRWRWPLQPQPQVAARFQAPPGPYAPGHRGVDLRATLNALILAPTGSRVDFVGQVAGVPVVTLLTNDGHRTTFQPAATTVPRGTPLAVGQPFAHISPGLSHCAPATCLHWGVLEDGAYIDPLSLVGAPRVRLLPAEPQRGGGMG